MHRCAQLAFASAFFGGLPLTALAGVLAPTVPTDSFIVQHVDSVSQLHQQISLDPVVRRRLARHFHISAPAVARYIQDNLVLKQTTASANYRVYCVSRSGQEYVINEHLPAGTPVFVMRTTGKPILKLACGNPMVAALPPVAGKVASQKLPVIAPAVKPDVTSAAVPAALQSSGPVLVAMKNSPSVMVMPTTRVDAYLGSIPAVHGGGSFPLGFLAGIPLLGLLGGHGGHTGGTPSTSGTTGTTGGSTLGTNTGGDTNGNSTGGTGTLGTNTGGTATGGTGIMPVPEPSPQVAFAVGGIGLLVVFGGAKRRARRQAK